MKLKSFCILPNKEIPYITLIRRNLVFIVAVFLAVLSCILIPVDQEYLHYFDYKTLTCLFCMLLIICALKNICFFKIFANKIIKLFKNTRASIISLVFITYISSMLIANDMALITFLPLSVMVLKSTGKLKFMPFTFIMQTLAANLGGMLTPFGNPQNLYLYNYFNISNKEFFSVMAIPFAVSLILLLVCCLFVKNEKLQLDNDFSKEKLNIFKTVIYGILFVYSILIVFRTVPFWTGFLMIPLIFIFDKKALFQVDYILLLTFAMFFIFAGNFSRISYVQRVLTFLMAKNTLLTGVLTAQVLSNVPTAILLSKFTVGFRHLLMAVNIGGCGTLISSLASLITFKQFTLEQPKKIKKYLIMYHLFNFGFLVILFTVCSFL